MVVLTTVLLKPSEELKDIVFLVSGFEGETTLLSAILDWSEGWLFWLCHGKNEEVAKLAVGVFNDPWTVVVTADNDDHDDDNDGGDGNIEGGDDNKDDVTDVDTCSVDSVDTNDEIVLDGHPDSWTTLWFV